MRTVPLHHIYPPSISADIIRWFAEHDQDPGIVCCRPGDCVTFEDDGTAVFARYVRNAAGKFCPDPEKSYRVWVEQVRVQPKRPFPVE